MTQQTATRTATFSATTSWVGVVLLGAGLTQVALPPSEERVPRSVGEAGSQIPEPLGAGVWLGVGTGVLAGGGILAALRRRFARTRSTAVDSSGRID